MPLASHLSRPLPCCCAPQSTSHRGRPRSAGPQTSPFFFLPVVCCSYFGLLSPRPRSLLLDTIKETFLGLSFQTPRMMASTFPGWGRVGKPPFSRGHHAYGPKGTISCTELGPVLPGYRKPSPKASRARFCQGMEFSLPHDFQLCLPPSTQDELPTLVLQGKTSPTMYFGFDLLSTPEGRERERDFYRLKHSEGHCFPLTDKEH